MLGQAFSQRDWGGSGKNVTMTRTEKAMVATTPAIGLGFWPIVFSTVLGGPIGFLVSSGITLAVAATSATVTYAVTVDDVEKNETK